MPGGTECAIGVQGVAITTNRCDGSITVLVNKLLTHKHCGRAQKEIELRHRTGLCQHIALYCCRQYREIFTTRLHLTLNIINRTTTDMASFT